MKLSQDLQHPTASGNSGPVINTDGTIRCVGMIENRGGALPWVIEIFCYRADFETHEECLAYMRAIQDVCNRAIMPSLQ